MKKILCLPLKKQWYEMIESGVKTEEYREIKPYWCNRIAYCRNQLCWFRDENGCVFRDSLRNINRLNYTHVKFSYGYTKRTMTFKLDSITIGKGNPEWGAPKEEVFIIKLGNKVIV